MNCPKYLFQKNGSSTKAKLKKRNRTEVSQNKFQNTHRILETLQDLIPLWPEQIDLSKPDATTNLLKRIRQALKAEHVRAINGHWAYNFARHTQLLRAFNIIDQLPRRAEVFSNSKTQKWKAKRGRRNKSRPLKVKNKNCKTT